MSNPESHSETLADPAGPRDPILRDLFIFEAGALVLAVLADQVDGTTEARVPAVLPHAPQGILGVVSVRGRMLTVIDPTVLLTGQALRWPHALPFVIALRGDEQLALAAKSCRDKITIEAADIVRGGEGAEENTGVLLGRVRYAGEEILVLDVNHLFASVMRQRERRRRRF
jgi:chemotaxis signal transduction protein